MASTSRFNTGRVLFIFGALLIAESFFMLLSALVNLCYPADGMSGFYALLSSSAVTAGCGISALLVGRRSPKYLGSREGYTIVGSVWIIFSLFGMLPFLFSKTIPNVLDAFFETISGFTTTGITILADIEALPHSLLFWRSMTQWLGGMGIVVLALTVIPFLSGGVQFFLAESTGPQHDKLQPRVADTARRLWGLYMVLTVICIFMLRAGGMTFFDAISHALSAVSTGGFSTKQASIAYWNVPMIQYTLIIFMTLSGINFSLLYLGIIKRKFYRLKQDEELRIYLSIIVITTLIITVVLLYNKTGSLLHNIEPTLRESLFNTVSIITTTGLTVTDYTQWNSFAYLFMLILMFIGGSAGSTAGGIKVVRFVVIVKNVFYTMRRLIHPNAVIPLRINNRAVTDSLVNTIYVFVSLFLFFVFVGTVALIASGLSLYDSFNISIASLSNVGPIETLAHLSYFAKFVVIFLMLFGRLEIFTLLLLCSSSLWRK